MIQVERRESEKEKKSFNLSCFFALNSLSQFFACNTEITEEKHAKYRNNRTQNIMKIYISS